MLSIPVVEVFTFVAFKVGVKNVAWDGLDGMLSKG
jgi:hypothetical protein